MNVFLFFFILLIVAGSTTFVAAETHNILTATAYLLPICLAPQELDTETRKCVTPTDEPTDEPVSPGNGSSGGGRTGVGPSSGSSILVDTPTSSNVVPNWIGSVVTWWADEQVTDQEFKNMMTYLLDNNIIPNDTPKPITIADLPPSNKALFMLWANGQIHESHIVVIINHNRDIGVW